MGWIFASGFVLLALLALAASKRMTRLALELAAAILLAGIAGYAWQGSPAMPGNPVSHAPAAGLRP